MSGQRPTEHTDDFAVARLREALDELTDHHRARTADADADEVVVTMAPIHGRSTRRLVAGIAACAAVGLGGALLVAVDRDDSSPSADSTGTVDEPSSSGVAVQDALAGYDLNIDGAQLVREESLDARTLDVAVWGDVAKPSYLTLTVRPGLASAYPEPSGYGEMRQDLSFPPTEGRA